MASEAVPPVSASDLADAFTKHSDLFTVSQVLSHSHWLVRLESLLSASDMAEELVKAGSVIGKVRIIILIIIGLPWGRKDTPAMPGSPLNLEVGVDVVECHEPEKFLQEINWPALKSARAAEAVFEIRGKFLDNK